MARMAIALLVFALSGCTVTGKIYYEKDCGQYGKTGSEINWTMGQKAVK